MIGSVFFSTIVVALVTARSTPANSPAPKLDGRIVGGVEVAIEDYPYQLSLELNGSHSCGASLIKPNVALTAAHCTAGKQPSQFRVRAGSSNRGSGGQVVDVVSICVHPKNVGTDYDVAVLHLSKSVEVGSGVQTVPLQGRGEEVLDGTLAVVTGWGTLSSGANSLPLVLQAVAVPKVGQESCQKSYQIFEISDRMTCYGYKEGGKDACQGDSGGPLVVDGKQVGVVSWGLGCASRWFPGVYAKVSDEEIFDHIEECIAKF